MADLAKNAVVNWKTTVIGAVIAGLMAVENYNGHGSAKGYIIAFAMAAFGAIAGDA